MLPKITKKIPIGELIICYPSAFEILINRGFHCIGCSMAAHETLEEGARVHGLDDNEIDILVKEIKEAVKKQAEFEKAVKEVAPKKGKNLVIKPIDKPMKKTSTKKMGKTDSESF